MYEPKDPYRSNFSIDAITTLCERNPFYTNVGEPIHIKDGRFERTLSQVMVWPGMEFGIVFYKKEKDKDEVFFAMYPEDSQNLKGRWLIRGTFGTNTLSLFNPVCFELYNKRKDNLSIDEYEINWLRRSGLTIEPLMDGRWSVNGTVSFRSIRNALRFLQANTELRRKEFSSDYPLSQWEGGYIIPQRLYLSPGIFTFLIVQPL